MLEREWVMEKWWACLSLFVQTEDYLKRKIRSRPERSELIRMHILEGECHTEPSVCLQSRQVWHVTSEDPSTLVQNAHRSVSVCPETSAEPSLQAKQLQLKRARLADDLNDKISQRPGPMELIHKNILPVHCSIKQAIIGKPGQVLDASHLSCTHTHGVSKWHMKSI